MDNSNVKLSLDLDCEEVEFNSLEEVFTSSNLFDLDISLGDEFIGTISCESYELKQELESLKDEGYDIYNESIFNKDGMALHIELISIDKQYRGKYLGVSAMQELKDIAKKHNINFIEGECRKSLISFYKSVGAVIENRNSRDSEYMLEKFYIDL